jgi:hypothetical protein
MQIVYKLWEGSWEDGAVLRTARNACSRGRRKCIVSGMTARISRSKPFIYASPRRSAHLFSTRGRQFAATHAECVFINGPSKQVIAPIVADSQASRGGRPQPRRNFDFHDDDRDQRGDFRNRPSQARRLPILCQRGRRAGAHVGLDRPRFLEYGPDEPILHSRQDA